MALKVEKNQTQLTLLKTRFVFLVVILIFVLTFIGLGLFFHNHENEDATPNFQKLSLNKSVSMKPDVIFNLKIGQKQLTKELLHIQKQFKVQE